MIHCLTQSYPGINETKKSNCLTARVCIHLCDSFESPPNAHNYYKNVPSYRKVKFSQIP